MVTDFLFLSVEFLYSYKDKRGASDYGGTSITPHINHTFSVPRALAKEIISILVLIISEGAYLYSLEK